jgi:methionyl-tRNA formyltransferase
LNPAAVRVVFMGSPAFAVGPLRALAEAGYALVGVVTQPDRPAGRGGRLTPPEARAVAEHLGLPVIQPETLRDEAARAELAAWRPDLFVVAAFGKILPRAVLAIPARGCINVHASLLPRWRGPSPITAAILAGDAETGVSIMEMAAKMDAGAVIAREAVPILPQDTTGTLETRLAELGARLLVGTLPGWYDGAIVAEAQDEHLASYCPLLKKEDGHLRAAMTAGEAERAVRAYNPWPGAFVSYHGERLGIWKVHVESAGAGPTPGSMVVAAKRPAIVFRDGLLVLDEVQRTGARRQSGQDFLNGQRGKLDPGVTLA